ncbi:MAG: tandem-95 repeat protein [Candidatus Viridilinea halotolerans]|uniref:Tandem-95 repeat protein n=1 Tax=Candidatus Viridilinea halotolerans TaxID=2491704 RepID=A0A426U1T8_9CHLR|nr:MAG: tandem-95 repeat protein [Candidatus Viridilinea halotolerans]
MRRTSSRLSHLVATFLILFGLLYPATFAIPAVQAAPLMGEAEVTGLTVITEGPAVPLPDQPTTVEVKASLSIDDAGDYRIETLYNWRDEDGIQAGTGNLACTIKHYGSAGQYEETLSFAIERPQGADQGLHRASLQVAVRKVTPDLGPCSVDTNASADLPDPKQMASYELVYGVGELAAGVSYPEGVSAQAFIDAYKRNGGHARVGDPDPDLVHLWGGYLTQGFTGGNGDPGSVIIYNHNFTAGCGAYQVKGQILDTYMDIGGPGGWYGGPVSDEEPSAPPHYQNFASSPVSNFERGFIASNGGGYEAHTYFPEISDVQVRFTGNGAGTGLLQVSYAVEIAPGRPNAQEEIRSSVFNSLSSGSMRISDGFITTEETGFANGKRYFQASTIFWIGVESEYRITLDIKAERIVNNRVERTSHYPPDGRIVIDALTFQSYGPFGEPGWSHPLDATPSYCSGSNGGEVPAYTFVRGRVSDGIERTSRAHVADAPLAELRVELSAGSQQFVTSTNSAGEYRFDNVPTGQGAYEVRVKFERDSDQKLEIRYGGNGDTRQPGQMTTVKRPFTIRPDGNVVDINMSRTAFLSADGVPADRLKDLALVYYHSLQGVYFFDDYFGVRPNLFISTYAHTKRGMPVHKYKGNNSSEIYIVGSMYSDNTNDKHPYLEWHEISHAIMTHSIGMPNVWFKPGNNHGGFDNWSTDDSWAEGYATFWPCVIYLEQGYGTRCSDIGLDMLENPYGIWSNYDGTSLEEFAVAGVLWDLYDGKNDKDSVCHLNNNHECDFREFADNIQLSLGTLGSIIINSEDRINNVYDLYRRLKDGDFGFSQEEHTSIDEIFKNHGFFLDTNGNQWHDSGEELGYGGKCHKIPFTEICATKRTVNPPLAQAHLLVHLQDESGVPVPASKFVVDVTFPEPLVASNYRYELDAYDSTLLFGTQIIPWHPSTTVNIHAEANGQTSNVLSFSAQNFYRALDNAKNGYISDYLHNHMQEYTFTLGSSTPIPFDDQPPTSRLSLAGRPGLDGWRRTDPVTVTLSAVDALTGMEYQEYSLDGGPWLRYVQPFTVGHDTLVAYRAVDWAGNGELTRERLVRIDAEPPLSSAALAPLPQPGDSYTQPVTITLSGTDSGPSGLARVEYRLNGGSWALSDPGQPLTVVQDGPNVLEYRAVDAAGNIEQSHVLTVTLDLSVHTIIPLDASQADRRAAYSTILRALATGRQPLLAMAPFTLTPEGGAPTNYPAGTVILEGDSGGSFTKFVQSGALTLPPAYVLNAQAVALFDSSSADERASWTLPDLRRTLETYPSLPQWPLVDEAGLAADPTADVIFFPAGVTPDVLARLQSSGADLPTQAAAGHWFVFEGDAALLAEASGLISTGTVIAGSPAPGTAPLTAVTTDTLLSLNWPTDLTLTRYSDTPHFALPAADLVLVANYTDTGDAAIALRRIGAGGVILIGGHPDSEAAYGLLYHALFTAAAAPVAAAVEVQQQFLPGVPPDVVPGFEPDVPVIVRTTVTNYSPSATAAFTYTEVISAGFTLLADPIVSTGSVTATATISGTTVTWTADTLPPGPHSLELRAANVATDTLKPGLVTISEAALVYDDGAGVVASAERTPATLRAQSAAFIAHNPTDEPDQIYPLPPEGAYRHVREDLENKLDTRANNVTYSTTIPLIDIVRDAADQTNFAAIKHFGWYRPIVYTDTVETHVFVANTVMGYADRDYLRPQGATDADWAFGLDQWDGQTWVRIPNPQRTYVFIPREYRSFVIQEPDHGDLLVPGLPLSFELGTLLPYDQREPAIRYLVHTRELFERGVSVSTEPVLDTLVVEGGGAVAYTAAGQSPIPFTEHLSASVTLNNPVAPGVSHLAYTDLWGRDHTVTETVRSSFLTIAPFARGLGDVSTRMQSTYGLTDADGQRIFDIDASEAVTLSITLKALSLNRTVSSEQMIIQQLLPRGLGYDIEFVRWESSSGRFGLLDEHTMRVSAFTLFNFQGPLDSDVPETITLMARVRPYEASVREGAFLVDGGARIATPDVHGGLGQFDTALTHARVEQGYKADLTTEKWLADADISRHGGQIYEAIRVNSTADVQRFTEEVYIDSVGAGDSAATVRVGGSQGAQLFFGSVPPGGMTLLTLELVNNTGLSWDDLAVTPTAPEGFTLTPLFTAGEAPPDVADAPYLWATTIPDVARGVYIYQVSVADDVPPGRLYPITFALTGRNVPDAATLPLPTAQVGVGSNVQQVLGHAHALTIHDSSPLYATPLSANWLTKEQFADFQALTTVAERDTFFNGLGQQVSLTDEVAPGAEQRQITYTLPDSWQTLPIIEGAAIRDEVYVLIRSQVDPLAPGNRLVNYGPRVAYRDDFGHDRAATGNSTSVIARGPVLTNTYILKSSSAPHLGGSSISPAAGEQVDSCVGIAFRNSGNYVAANPVVSTTVNVAELAITTIRPEPLSVNGGVITWALPDLVPAGAVGDQDAAQVEVCVQFIAPDLAAQAEVRLIEQTAGRYEDRWGEQSELIAGTLGGSYTLRLVTHNFVPTFTSEPLTSGTEDASYHYLVRASDLNSQDRLRFAALSLPLWLTLTDNGDGTASLTGTPVVSDVGMHSVVLEVRDDADAQSIQRFTITVSDYDDAPTIATIADQETDEDTPVGPIPVLIGDEEVAAANLIISALSSDQTLVPDDAIVMSGDGAERLLTLTPEANQFGQTTITVTVTDGTSVSSTSFTLTIHPVNDAPIAVDDQGTGATGRAIVLPVLGNDYDVDGDSLAIMRVSQPTHGVVTFTTTMVTYTSHRDYAGDDSFTYTVRDGQGGEATATVRVATILGAPSVSAVAPQFTQEDVPTSPFRVIVADSESPAAELTLSGTAADPTLVPDTGIRISGDEDERTIIITPAPDQWGTTTITLTVSDGITPVSTSFMLTVEPVNDAPVAVDDQGTGATGRAIVLPVLGNDYDVDGDSLAIMRVSQPTHGVVTFTTTMVTYTSHRDYAGDDSFTYTVRDGQGGEATATVRVATILGAPSVSAVAPQFTQENVPTAPFRVVVADGESPASELTLSGTAADPTLVPDTGIRISGEEGERTIIITPAPDQWGTTIITLTVSDGITLVSTSFMLTVEPVNNAPVAVDDVALTSPHTEVIVAALDNDTDVDGDILVIEQIGTPLHGVAINTGTEIRYLPAPGFSGTDSFTYRINDGNGGNSTAKVTITVGPIFRIYIPLVWTFEKQQEWWVGF